MRKNLRLTAVALVLLLTSATASWAQATRTWVSGTGDDANPCSRTAPCKTFAGAISKTAAAGEIDVLDSGGFGGLTISKSLSIIATGTIGGVLVSGTNGITVAAGPNDVVLLRGLDIAGNGSGLNGVSVSEAATVEIEDCRIFGFTGAGVLLSSNQPSRVHVLGSGIFSNTFGVSVQGGTAVNGMVLESTSVDHNTSANITLSGMATVLLNDTSLLASPSAIAITSGSPTVQSFGNNRITGSAPTLSSVALR